MPTKPIEVHNVWTIYALNPDGSRAEQPLAAAGRPQDWGDKSRWTYHRFRFEWQTAPDQRAKHWINNFHGWTDLQLEPGDYPDLFAPLISKIMWPGTAWQFCGDQFLREDDFWRESWGPLPPYYDGPDQPFDQPPPGFEPEPEEEAAIIQMMTRAFKEPKQVKLQVDAFELFQLIGLIQFATKGLPPNHTLHSFARHAGDQLAEAVIVATGAEELRAYIERGWNPAYDVVQQDSPLSSQERGLGGEV